MLVRLAEGSITMPLLGIANRTDHAVELAPKSRGLYLGRPQVSTLVTKAPKAGDKAEAGYPAGSVLRLSYGPIAPTKHPVLVDINPALLEHGHASLCGRYLPGEESELVVVLTLFKSLSIEELPSWQVRVALDAQS